MSSFFSYWPMKYELFVITFWQSYAWPLTKHRKNCECCPTACPKWNKGPPWKFPGDLEISRGPWNFQGPWIFPGPGNFQATLKFPGVCVFYTHGKFQGGSKGKCISQSTTPPLKNRAWFCYQKSAQTFIFDNRVTMLISFRPLSLSIGKLIRLIHHSSLDNALFLEVTFMNCSLITEIFIVPSFCVVIWFFFISLMPLHSLTIALCRFPCQ